MEFSKGAAKKVSMEKLFAFLCPSGASQFSLAMRPCWSISGLSTISILPFRGHYTWHTFHTQLLHTTVATEDFKIVTTEH